MGPEWNGYEFRPNINSSNGIFNLDILNGKWREKQVVEFKPQKKNAAFEIVH